MRWHVYALLFRCVRVDEETIGILSISYLHPGTFTRQTDETSNGMLIDVSIIATNIRYTKRSHGNDVNTYSDPLYVREQAPNR